MNNIRLIDRIFRMEAINGDQRCPTYLWRWTLIRTPWFRVYLHHFVGDDWSRDMHDHPKRFWSIGLWGRYTEETPDGSTEYRAPWFRTFPATHIHRIRAAYSGGAWTLVIVGRPKREWGFHHKGHWIPWKTYVYSHMTDESVSCE
jgi:hypothetical protein